MSPQLTVAIAAYAIPARKITERNVTAIVNPERMSFSNDFIKENLLTKGARTKTSRIEYTASPRDTWSKRSTILNHITS